MSRLKIARLKLNRRFFVRTAIYPCTLVLSEVTAGSGSGVIMNHFK